MCIHTPVLFGRCVFWVMGGGGGAWRLPRDALRKFSSLLTTIFVFVFVCIHIYIHICIYAYICIDTYGHVCMYGLPREALRKTSSLWWVCLCMCVYIQTYIDILITLTSMRVPGMCVYVYAMCARACSFTCYRYVCVHVCMCLNPHSGKTCVSYWFFMS